MKRAFWAVCGAVLASAAMAGGASAATLVGDYQFQNTLDSTGSVGPPLTNVGAGAGSFLSAPVFGAPRSVHSFPAHSGLRMSPAGVANNTAYSVVTTFKLDDVSGYRRVLDTSDDAQDGGVYIHDGKASIGHNFESPGPVVTAGNFATLTYVTNFPDIGSQVYINGVPAWGSTVSYTVPANAIRFFKDAGPAPADEDSSGAVSCIRVFDGKLTEPEILAIGASATCGGPPTAPPAPLPAVTEKKCKKKKGRKKSAAEAKKKGKKCKRKRGKGRK